MQKRGLTLISNMGKLWRKKRKAVDKREKKERPKVNYVEIIRENSDFETFYKTQKIVPENEWDEFITAVKQDLPTAFRFTGTSDRAQALLHIVKEKFFVPLTQQNELHIQNGETSFKMFKAQSLPWYPDNLGWQMNLTRKDIRSHELYWKLHQCLISESENGNISRQEAVSMIPPLVLDVESHHKVLDMCAAPGSKTAQIIEYLHNSGKNGSEGVVIANDIDNNRCYMLTHQAKRLQSSNIIITNHDAAFMPNIYHTQKDGAVSVMKFDRILCDVPCTGDGTLRKNFDIWSKWNNINGANLHGLQLRIARRGLELLKVGGRLVYSTCSFHPLENEAVINRLLSQYGDSISLVDVKDSLPGLKTTPGLSHWTLMTRELEIIDSPEKIAIKDTNIFSKHLFPPTDEEKQARHLERCVRVLPHHQNTGGFFIAVLTKNKPLPTEKETNETNAAENKEAQRVKLPPKKRPRNCYKEEPFYYFQKDNTSWPVISSFYNVCDSFDMTLLLRRAEEGKGRTIYYTNSLVKNILQNNKEKLKVINAGLKVLARCDNLGTDCKYRLAQDGIQALLPYVRNRKMNVQRNDLILMLTSDDEAPPSLTEMHQSTQELCSQIGSGSIIYEYADNSEHPFTMNLVGWKGNTTLRVYLCKNERVHYLRMLGGDTSMYEKNKFVEQRLNEENGNIDEENSKKSSVIEDDKNISDMQNKKLGSNNDSIEKMDTSDIDNSSVIDKSDS